MKNKRAIVLDCERRLKEYMYALENLMERYHSRDVIEKVEQLTDSEEVAQLFSSTNPRHYLIENSYVAGWLGAALLTGHALEKICQNHLPQGIYEKVRDLNSAMLQCAKYFTLINLLSEADFAEVRAINEMNYTEVPKALLLGSPFIWDNLYMMVKESYALPSLNEVPEPEKVKVLKKFLENLLEDIDPNWMNYGTVDNLLWSAMERAEVCLKKLVGKIEDYLREL